MGGKHGEELCPRYQRAIDIIGKRWTGLILRVLLAGPRRFGEIEDVVGGLSARMLSERLKELEACGIVERRVYPEAPVRIEYALTEKGRGLQRALDELQRWADRWECDAPPARERRARLARLQRWADRWECAPDAAAAPTCDPPPSLSPARPQSY
jgi:DNA-binding HxlR family transcriptional regulator